MDSPMRRSGIPIPKSKTTTMKKSLSKSNDNLLSDSIDPHNQSSELDVFTLLEENIALKEKIEDLSAKHNTSKHMNCFVIEYQSKCRHTNKTHVFLFLLRIRKQFYRKTFNLSVKIAVWGSSSMT